MKKSKIYIFALILGSVLLITGCSKDKDDDNNGPNNCSALADAAANAASAFVTNMTEETCEAYIKAIHDYYDGCALVPAAEKESYDEWLSQANCSVYGGQ